MNFSDQRALFSLTVLAVALSACSDGARTSFQPAVLAAQPGCQNGSEAKPDEADDIVWKSCTHNGDHCECAYDMSYKPPILGVYACEGGYGTAFGLAATPKRLYAGYENTVLEFAGKKLIATLTGLTGDPIGLAVDAAGDVWATNSPSATISEFAPGATSPTATYTDSNLTSASYIAVDAAGDVYVEGQSAYSIEVDELPSGSTTFNAVALPGKVGSTPGGLAVQNPSGKIYLWINDQGAASRPASISKYLLTGGSLKSIGSFQYKGINGAIWADPAGKHPSRVFAINNIFEGSSYASSAIEYSMPSGKVVNATTASTSLPGAAEAVGIAGAFK